MNFPSLIATAARSLPQTYRPPSLQKADPKNILGSGRLHPALTQKVERFIEKAEAQGLNLRVVEGFRNSAKQAEAYANGISKAKPGFSFHNYGLAVDVVFRDEKGNPSWNEGHDWKRLGEIGKETGLYWGGDWKTFNDRPHFQLLPNDQLGSVRQLTQEVGMEKMWEKIR